MKFYYLSTSSNDHGNFEVHERDCSRLPDLYDRDYLGPFNSGDEALRKALTVTEDACVCEECCKSTFQAIIVSTKVR